MQTPKFIAIEGGEGSGKSSLVRALKEKFGDSLTLTREPGGSPFGEVIREAALKHPLSKEATAETMMCLMFASRYDHVDKLVIPSLNEGKPVITDRFDASSYAYQIHAQEASQAERLFWELRSNVKRLPDLYIYVDVEVKEGLKRARSRNAKTDEGNHFDGMEVDFHKRLRRGYEEFFKKVPHIVINANRPLNEVKEDFINKVIEYLEN